jgi:hypothetical protein
MQGVPGTRKSNHAGWPLHWDTLYAFVDSHLPRATTLPCHAIREPAFLADLTAGIQEHDDAHLIFFVIYLILLPVPDSFRHRTTADGSAKFDYNARVRSLKADSPFEYRELAVCALKEILVKALSCPTALVR